MKILVLGGTGAIGINCVQLFISEGHTVYVTSRQKHLDLKKCHYLQGNAKDDAFLDYIINEFVSWDAIIDFMVYSSKEFEQRIDKLLSITEQYVFFSSARVYSNNDAIITEKTPRILDISEDEDYLASDEYALAKARQENLLLLHKKNNWTILRPYITYDSNRLQLGGLEKESWLYRALSCNSIVFFKDIAEHYTTMTFGLDVAKVIYCLVGNKNAMGKCIQIASSEFVKWHDVFKIYIEIIEAVTGKQLEVRWLSSFPYEMEKIFNKKYQIKYDRLYDRKFDSALVNKVCGKNFCYTNIRTGLRICLENFIKGNVNKVFSLDIQFEALLDRELGQKIVYRHLSSTKDKLNYLLWYYFPAFSIFFRKIRDKASKKNR